MQSPILGLPRKLLPRASDKDQSRCIQEARNKRGVNDRRCSKQVAEKRHALVTDLKTLRLTVHQAAEGAWKKDERNRLKMPTCCTVQSARSVMQVSAGHRISVRPSPSIIRQSGNQLEMPSPRAEEDCASNFSSHRGRRALPLLPESPRRTKARPLSSRRDGGGTRACPWCICQFRQFRRDRCAACAPCCL